MRCPTEAEESGHRTMLTLPSANRGVAQPGRSIGLQTRGRRVRILPPLPLFRPCHLLPSTGCYGAVSSTEGARRKSWHEVWCEQAVDDPLVHQRVDRLRDRLVGVARHYTQPPGRHLAGVLPGPWRGRDPDVGLLDRGALPARPAEQLGLVCGGAVSAPYRSGARRHGRLRARRPGRLNDGGDPTADGHVSCHRLFLCHRSKQSICFMANTALAWVG